MPLFRLVTETVTVCSCSTAINVKIAVWLLIGVVLMLLLLDSFIPIKVFVLTIYLGISNGPILISRYEMHKNLNRFQSFPDSAAIT